MVREKKKRWSLFSGKGAVASSSQSSAVSRRSGVSGASSVSPVSKSTGVGAVATVSPFLALHGTLREGKSGNQQEALKELIFHQLTVAMATGDVGSSEAQILVDLHRRWICFFWRDGMYSKGAHLRLADIYVAEPRFTAWYDNRVGRGGAKFLRDAIEVGQYRVGMPLPPKDVARLQEMLAPIALLN